MDSLIEHMFVFGDWLFGFFWDGDWLLEKTMLFALIAYALLHGAI